MSAGSPAADPASDPGTDPAQAASEDALRSRRVAFRRLGGYLLRNRSRYAFGLVTTLAYAASSVAIPLLVAWCVRSLLEGLPSGEVARRAAILAAATAARAGLRFLSRTRLFYAAREIEYQLRNDLFAHLQRLPQSFYASWRTGDLMSRCVNDLNSLRLLLGPGLLAVIQNPPLYLGVLGAMFAINAKLALLVLAPYPLFILVARGFGRHMHVANVEVQEGLADLSSQLQETVSGISVVKAYAMEDTTRKRFEAASDALYRRHVRLARVSSAMPAIVSLLPALAMWVVFLVGGRLVVGGEMTVDRFFAFAMYVYELTFPTFIMGWVFALWQRGGAAMQRIDEILSTAPSIADHDSADVDALRGEIEFRKLTFRYPGAEREPALRDVDLHVPAGSVLGVVGPVGSGKTSLASLVPRLYEVEDGSVFLDGVDVNRIPLQVLRSNIAMVPQDSFLFSMSLAENVAYGLPEADPARVAAAAQRAQLAKDVDQLPHGFDTVVGERGVMLSGGQRQRTALARALALDPSILILDDTLSAVDAQTEAAIQHELARVFEGRTVVLIASRVSTVRDADHIVVLDEGRIVEQGDHEALLARGGLYARLAREQALEDELEELDVAEGVG